jgi:hypothetical protein
MNVTFPIPFELLLFQYTKRCSKHISITLVQLMAVLKFEFTKFMGIQWNVRDIFMYLV